MGGDGVDPHTLIPMVDLKQYKVNEEVVPTDDEHGYGREVIPTFYMEDEAGISQDQGKDGAIKELVPLEKDLEE